MQIEQLLQQNSNITNEEIQNIVNAVNYHPISTDQIAPLVAGYMDDLKLFAEQLPPTEKRQVKRFLESLLMGLKTIDSNDIPIFHSLVYTAGQSGIIPIEIANEALNLGKTQNNYTLEEIQKRRLIWQSHINLLQYKEQLEILFGQVCNAINNNERNIPFSVDITVT